MTSKINIIKNYYEENLKKGGSESDMMGWENEIAHKMRFDVFLSYVDPNKKTLLDVGCGIGSLINYLKEKNLNVDYTGVDILKEMLDEAKMRHPENKFMNIDIFKENAFEDNSFDIVYASGVFNLNLGNNMEFLENALEIFFRISSKSIAFNLLHIHSQDKEDKYFYYTPQDVVKILDNLKYKSQSIQIVEHYLKNDFTVVCSKL